ncbi:hypothetical protein CHS0354_017173 [Potamilus streckersoni]|uniref:EF-hand domain-containing protein n=1 Tax=Potamilus streckersoni TaxID=2493646 RepID=A0AAE0W5X9_9BIVA|nr:hypothetical protein CHS0354_017173 [Potamilus streckersoni]
MTNIFPQGLCLICSVLYLNFGLCISRNINLENVSKDIKIAEKDILSVDKLVVPEHLDAIKMEQNGMLNKDYKKEIFLGDHEEIENDDAEIAESKLKDIFSKVDSNKDNQLTVEETEGWILEKVQEHFKEALEETKTVFKHLDPDADGLVDWKEYYVHFLLAMGHPIEKATQHVKDYDVIDMDFNEREQLIRYKFKWTDADQDPIDNKLSESEFFAFRHPEQSPQTLKTMLQSIMNSLDKDEDGALTEKEFISFPLTEFDDEEQRQLDNNWQANRQKEFQARIDSNHDGKATKEELEVHKSQEIHGSQKSRPSQGRCPKSY